MLKRLGRQLGILTAVCGLALMAMPIVEAQTVALRAVVAHDADEIPQFTIQVDAFESLTDAVEFGYELPFDENTLGLAKFRQGSVVRYILALGTFYTYGEAEGVRREMCPSAALDNCRVRYLGDLESIDVDTSEDIAEPAVIAAVDAPADVTIMPALVIEDEAAAYVLEEDLSLPIDDDEDYRANVSEPEYFEDILEAEDELLGEASVLSLAVPEPVSVQAFDTVRAYDADIVYTVQVAAMYRKSDAERIVEKIPLGMGNAEILPLIGGRGNLVYSVIIGRFAYNNNAQVFAEDICDAVDLSGCWVKPLAMVERELKQVSSEPPLLLQAESDDEPPSSKAGMAVPLVQEEPEGDRMVYTVQVVAMYDENDAQNVASRISEQNGAVEVVPIRSVGGDVVYSVTVGRFAFKDVGREAADSVCSQLNLSGCWVKPFALIEKARVEEW